MFAYCSVPRCHADGGPFCLFSLSMARIVPLFAVWCMLVCCSRVWRGHAVFDFCLPSLKVLYHNCSNCAAAAPSLGTALRLSS